MALKSHYLPLDKPKNSTLVRSRKRCFKWSPGIVNTISPLTSPKCDFGEVEEAMFQGLLCYLDLIFGLLTIPKCNLVDVEKALLLGLARHFQIFSETGTAEHVNWVNYKKRLF